MILGAVLAGGRSSRFGTDKALAELHGRSLLDHAVEALRDLCDQVVVVGRDDAPAPCIADWPAPDAGPLGGMAGALNHARDHGFASVLTVGVDSVGLPADLLDRLSPPPCYVESQPVIGHWPTSAAATVAEILSGTGKHSIRAFAERISAKAVAFDRAPSNINTAADLAAAERRHGL